MTAKIEEVKIVGIGYVLDPVNENELVAFEDFALTNTPEIMKYKKSDSYDSASIPIGVDWTFKCTFKGITAALLQKLIGGTLSTTANSDILMEGSGEVPGTPYAYTLPHAPVNSSTERSFKAWQKDSDGNIDYLERVDSNPSAGQYTLSGTTMTFASGDEGETFYYKGYYAGSSDASSITMAPSDDFPSPLTFKAVLACLTNGNKKKYVSVLMKNVVRTNPITIGGPVQDIAKFTIEGDVSIESSGDVVIKFQNP